MKNLTIATAFAAGLGAAVLGLAAPTAAAPTGGNADAVISQLEAQGHRVVVNRLSDAALSQASVVGINKGGDIRGTVRDFRYDRTYQNSKTGASIYYVDVK
ncbi:hypothetical protein C6A87_026795 [Mycobacterium sp. ITM-2016-00317]|uniref:hypothetical protein n=1 Tax=Mycobacterium sp. ITM-2016-00317 TaxID=2099694 RepID=UPI00287F9CEE|nr:hypothetical protein [Mycobacterium sp. ITM-2016-00317]WNG87316.1 hypothetical protein C6A87_026795 [Mycobacterium sp. ITM-2016-00317]